MPLITVNCSKFYFPPPDNPVDPRSPTGVIVTSLPGWLAKIINAVDGLDGSDLLLPQQVFVNIGRIHSSAQNASDMQVVVWVGLRRVLSNRESTRRKTDILAALARCFTALFLGDDTHAWPRLDIEVQLVDMAGCTVSDTGAVVATWG